MMCDLQYFITLDQRKVQICESVESFVWKSGAEMVVAVISLWYTGRSVCYVLLAEKDAADRYADTCVYVSMCPDLQIDGGSMSQLKRVVLTLS